MNTVLKPSINTSALPLINKGLLAKIVTSGSGLDFIYEVDKNSWVPSLTICILNTGSTVSTFNLYITTSKTPGRIDLIEKNISVDPSALFVRSNESLSQLEKIVIETVSSDFVVRVIGEEVMLK